MTREEQDRNWAELFEESQKKHRQFYEVYKDYEIESYYYHVCRQMEKAFGSHNLQPKPKEYWEIEEELFNHRANQWLSYYTIDWDKPHSTATQIVKSDCTSEKQADKIIAINKILNVAKFLNKNEDGTDWVPDFNNESQPKWYLYIDYQSDEKGKIIIDWKNYIRSEVVYFRTEALAKQAIEILGEETIRTALGNY